MYNLKHEAIMYIENDEFGEWMQKLYAKLEELCKDVRVLRNADRVLPEDDNLLDNQDLCLLFKVSIKTLQRYRAIRVLPHIHSSHVEIPEPMSSSPKSQRLSLQGHSLHRRHSSYRPR